MSEPEVEYLTTVAALEIMRHEDKGPAYYKFNKRAVRYRRADLVAWAEGLKVVPVGQ